MFELKEEIWLIMSKDRKVVAKGTPRNRELIAVDDKKDKKRFLTYSSKGKAEAGFRDSFFYQYKLKSEKQYTTADLEAVRIEVSMKEI